jgi:hypothetical protein
MSSAAFSPLHVACCQLSVAYFPLVVCGIGIRGILSACPFFVAHRTFSVACCLFACPSVPCRMACAVRRLSHVASRHVAMVACCCVASRLLSVAFRTSHFAWCDLSVARSASHLVTVHVAALRVVGCMLQTARPLVAWCLLAGACPILHVACCPLSFACCTLSLACRLRHCCPLDACRLLPVAEWHSAVTHAAHRGGART